MVGVETQSILDIIDNNEKLTNVQRLGINLTALSEYVDGYSLIGFGSALIFLGPYFHISAYLLGVSGAAAFVGMALGLIVSGYFTDKLGRRKIFVWSLVFFVILSILSALMFSATELIIMRLLIGATIGIDIPASLAYLAEVSPKRKRGRYTGAFPPLDWTLGVITSAIVALVAYEIVGDSAWRIIVGFAAIPAFVVVMLRRELPESPRWLLTKGRRDEAKMSFSRLGYNNGVIPEKFELPNSRFTDMFKKPYGIRIVASSSLWFLNCLSAGLVTVSEPFVLRYIGFVSIADTFIFTAITWVFSFLGTLLGFYLIDKIGRKKVSYVGAIPSGIVALFMGLFFLHNSLVLPYLFIALGFFDWLGTSAPQWGWGSELFPTRLRGKTQGFCNSWCRWALALNVFLIPAVIVLGLTAFKSLIVIFAVLYFIYSAVIYIFPFLETKGKSLEEISPN